MTPATRPWSIDALREGGFEGFVPLSGLATAGVPAAPGVYVVLRASDVPPTFLPENPAGRFKGKDPSLELDVLQQRWLDGPQVVYIGKATLGSAGRRGLQKRLGELQRFGAGEPVAHWGGRALWQLEGSGDLLAAWRVTDEDAAALESRMLQDFAERYGALPFANLRR